MFFRIVLAVLLLVPATVWGEAEQFPLLKVGDNYYTNVTITSVTKTDIYFSHCSGIGNAKLKKLSPALQMKFRVESAKAMAKQFEQSQVKAQTETAASTAQVEPKAPQATNDVKVPRHELTARSFMDRPAPPLSVGKWLTAPPDTSGKFILIDFFATWCSPCRRSIPELNKISDKYKDKLVIIGISDENERDVRSLRDPKIGYHIAVDPQHRASTAVGVERIPHALLVDPKGIVRFEGHPGYLADLDLEQLFAKYQ